MPRCITYTTETGRAENQRNAQDTGHICRGRGGGEAMCVGETHSIAPEMLSGGECCRDWRGGTPAAQAEQHLTAGLEKTGGLDPLLRIPGRGPGPLGKRGWKSGEGRPGGLHSRDWHQKAKSTCLRPVCGREGWKRREGSARGSLSSGMGAACPGVVSFRTRQGRGRPQGQERVLDLGLQGPLPTGSEAGGSARTEWPGDCPQVVLLPLNSPTGKCLT